MGGASSSERSDQLRAIAGGPRCRTRATTLGALCEAARRTQYAPARTHAARANAHEMHANAHAVHANAHAMHADDPPRSGRAHAPRARGKPWPANDLPRRVRLHARRAQPHAVPARAHAVPWRHAPRGWRGFSCFARRHALGAHGAPRSDDGERRRVSVNQDSRRAGCPGMGTVGEEGKGKREKGKGKARGVREGGRGKREKGKGRGGVRRRALASTLAARRQALKRLMFPGPGSQGPVMPRVSDGCRAAASAAGGGNG